MSGVFVSYSRGDRAIAYQIVRGLRALGVEVWWDEDMPGVNWQRELARQINELSAVAVIWTPLSIESGPVGDEARLGQRVDKLVNVLIGVAEPPFPYDRINGLPLDGWNGRDSHRGWTKLVDTVEDHLVRAGVAQPGALKARLREREEAIARCRDGVSEAERTFLEAKAADAKATRESAAAETAYQDAERQLHSVVEMRAGAAILKAAQTQLDEANAGIAAARAATATAEAALSEAARRLTRARGDLSKAYGEDDAGAPGQPAPHATPPAEEPEHAAPVADIAAAADTVGRDGAAPAAPVDRAPAAPAPDERPARKPASADQPASPARPGGAVANLQRGWRLMLRPRAVWDEIAAAPASARLLLFGFAGILALIPAAAQLGYRVLFGPCAFGVCSSAGSFAPIQYVVCLGEVLLTTAIVNALAPRFGGRRDFHRALNLVAYAWTPAWLAGVFGVTMLVWGMSIGSHEGFTRCISPACVEFGLPLSLLVIALAAGGYSLNLFRLGLPRLMQSPQDRTAGYAAVSVLASALAVVGMSLALGLARRIVADLP